MILCYIIVGASRRLLVDLEGSVRLGLNGRGAGSFL